MKTPEERREINRQNASKSTGPVTAAGKARVAQNGHKHGLNTPAHRDPRWSSRIGEMAEFLAEGAEVTPAGHDNAYWEVELLRIQYVKDQAMKPLFARREGNGLTNEEVIAAVLEEVRRIMGYERKVRSRLARARRAADEERRMRLADQTDSTPPTS